LRSPSLDVITNRPSGLPCADPSLRRWAGGGMDKWICSDTALEKIIAGRLNQPLDLALGQVLAGPICGIFRRSGGSL